MWTAIIDWVLAVTQGLGYSGLVVLMTIESSFLPLPSEIIIPPAAYLASQGKMSLLLIVIFGTLGSILGASVNYALSRSLGRMIIFKLAAQPWARLFLITPKKIDDAERYFLSSAKSATFLGRLVPVIRHLISIPAGFSRMPFGPFLLYTALGSAVWVSILAALGYFIGANQHLLSLYYREISAGLLTLGVAWVGWKIIKARGKAPEKDKA